MTLCVGMICDATSEDGAKIITVSDQLLIFEDISADCLALKSTPIHKNWYALYASSDVGHIPFILGAIARDLARFPGDKSAVEVADLANAAVQGRLRREIESRVLSRNGFDLPGFRRSGRKQLTEHAFQQLFERINDVSLECDLLICGFDPDGEPHLITICDSDAGRNWNPVGFSAIGSGARVALDALVVYADKRKLNQNSELPTSLFCACGAKFMAESVRTVGRDHTFVSVFARDKRIRYLRPLAWRDIRSEWERVGMPHLPSQLISKIPDWLLFGDEIRAEMRRVSGTTVKTS